MPSLYEQWGKQEKQKPSGLYDQWSAEQPAQDELAQDQGGWWQEHGRTVENAALAGLALLGGGAALRGVRKGISKSAPLEELTTRAGGAVKSVLAPSTVDEAAGRAAATIREHGGEAARQTAQAQARLEPLWPSIGGAPENVQRDFIAYVERHSRGAAMPAAQKPLADEMRSLMDAVHKDMRALKDYQKIGFVDNYYSHQWVKNENFERAFSKQGKGYFTKGRTIPTIEEGIAQGLTPKTLDPVETTLEYISNARRFIASNKMIEVGKDTGDIIVRQLGTKKPFPTQDRWVPIEGALGKRGGHQVYAKEGWARVFNNYMSPGFTGAAGDVVHSMRRVSNTMTGLELGLSGFHATTMANEAIINDVANAILSASKGKASEALKQIVRAPIAPIRLAKTGSKLQKVYLGEAGGTTQEKELTNLLMKAGGRAVGMGHAKDYEYTALGSLWKAWKRGALKAEMRHYGEGIRQAPVTGSAKAITSLIGRTMQTVMEPLFRVYIPKLKTGAFGDNMALWLKHNPTASEIDKITAARKIWDSIDNRFGELVQDNIFWRQHLKQLSMIAMRSYSWNLGTAREIGGGIMDIGKHEMSQRAAYTIALPLVYGTVGVIYQYMKTGEKPKDIQDLIAPRTGGVDAATGLPERMIMPGYMKDVFGWMEDPLQEAQNKLATAPSMVAAMARGTDWRGDPIAPPTDPNAPWEQTAPEWLKAYFGYVGQAFAPISVREMWRGGKEGTNITMPERLGGLRAAGRRYVDPEGLEAIRESKRQKAWQTKQKHDIREKQQYEEW